MGRLEKLQYQLGQLLKPGMPVTNPSLLWSKYIRKKLGFKVKHVVECYLLIQFSITNIMLNKSCRREVSSQNWVFYYLRVNGRLQSGHLLLFVQNEPKQQSFGRVGCQKGRVRAGIGGWNAHLKKKLKLNTDENILSQNWNGTRNRNVKTEVTISKLPFRMKSTIRLT